MPTQPVATTTIPIDRIQSNPNQPRKYFDPQAIQDLKESMEKRGLINPISVREVRDEGGGNREVLGDEAGADSSLYSRPSSLTYEIIAGERRYRAARELKW